METKSTNEKLELYKDNFDNNIVTADGFFVAEFKDEKTAKLFLKTHEMFEMLKETIDRGYSEGITFAFLNEIQQLIKEATEI